MPKRRLSASVDSDLIAAAAEAVSQGGAESVSAWVNDALRLKCEHERRLAGLRAFIADYEAEAGVITEREMEQAYRDLKARAIVVRGGRVMKPSGKRRAR